MEEITVLTSVGLAMSRKPNAYRRLWGKLLLYVVGWHPILCLGKEIWVCVPSFGYFLAEVRVVRALLVESNRVSPVVELMNHSALVQRQIQLITLLPTIALNRIKTFRFELRHCPEKMGVVGHVKHRGVLDRPRLPFLTS